MGQRKDPSAAGSGLERRFFFLRILLIAGGAFLLRFLTAAELAAVNGGRNSIFMPSSATDLATYLKLADQIREGTFQLPFYYQPFYYAVFLPVIRWFSTSPWLLIAVQSLLGAGACFLAGLAAARMRSRRAGYWTALLCAVCVPLLLYTPFAMNETLQSFNLILLLCLVLKLLREESCFSAAVAGAVWGVAILTRGNALLFAAILLVLAVRRRAWKTGWIVLAVSVAVQLPFIFANSRHLKRFSGPSTAADAVLALGNTPEAPAGGRNVGLPAGPMEYPETYQDFMERSRTKPVSCQMLEWMCREPGAFFELQFRKVLLFWTGGEIPNNVSLYGEGGFSRILRWDLIGRSAVLLSLVLAGMLVMLPRLRQDRWLWLYGMVVLYWFGTALFYNLSRFRAPILPAALIFAGCFMDRTCLLIRKKAPLLKNTVLPLVFGIFTVNGAYDLYRQHGEAAVQRLVRPDGILYRKWDGEILQLDHGPFSFGGWELLEVSPGMEIQKAFARLPENAGGQVRWTVFVPEGGSLAGTVEDTPFLLEKPGLNVVSAARVHKTGPVVLRIREATQGCAVPLDCQRQYNRSRLNGEPVRGEFIVRINHRRNEK